MRSPVNAVAVALGAALLGSAAVLAAASVEVGQSNKVFEKTAITVAVGDTVNFVNRDTVAHNVMSRSAEAFNLGIMKPGETKAHKFSKAGTHEVKCALHPRMKMTVEVK